ncbi:MAG: hypothetical protein R3Y54_13265, partial [Eubacteriales bacterium]
MVWKHKILSITYGVIWCVLSNKMIAYLADTMFEDNNKLFKPRLGCFVLAVIWYVIFHLVRYCARSGSYWCWVMYGITIITIEVITVINFISQGVTFISVIVIVGLLYIYGIYIMEIGFYIGIFEVIRQFLKKQNEFLQCSKEVLKAIHQDLKK